MPTASDSKAAWRAWAAERHTPDVADGTEAAIVAGLRAHLAGLDPGVIVVFSALPGEVHVDGLVEPNGEHGFALTRTPATGWLTIHAWDAAREMHHYGFSQPVESAPQTPFSEVRAVLVPALAFDRAGYRLGRGAGYYDQLFSRMPPFVERIGVIPSALVVDELPREPHDIPMHTLATENGCVRVG